MRLAAAVRRSIVALLATASLVSSNAVPAQVPVQRPVRLPPPGRAVASVEDSTALVLNPANLAFLTSAEFRWSSIYLDETNTVPHQGHAFGLALPLFLGLSTGVRVDFVDPPASARSAFAPFEADTNYQWLTWGLALGGESASLGFSYQRSYSDSPAVDALGSYSLGISLRPFDALGFSAVAQHLNGPTNELGGRIDPAYDVGIALRPFGTRAAELALEGRYLEDRDIWIPKAVLGIDVPPIGRLRGDIAVSDPDNEDARAWTATAGLSIYTNGPGGSSDISGGILTGDGLGESGSLGYHADVAFRGFSEPSGPNPAPLSVRVRIEDTPGARGHVKLLRRLWSYAEDERIRGVLIELRTSPADSLAHAQELRDAIAYLRKNRKRVLCHLEDATGSAVYVCSMANRVLINPAGGVRFAGLSSRHIYLAGMLKKLGVRADFVRIGKHKSAPERLTRTGPTDTARKDKRDLLDQYEREFVAGISVARRVPVKQLRESFRKGPFIAKEAKQAKLVDDFAFDDELEEELDDLIGQRTLVLDDDPAEVAPTRFGPKPQLAIVYVAGDMVDGRSSTIPLLGPDLAGSYTIAEALKKARENPRIGAVVLRVETPGGSAMAADVIWREVQLTAKRKPVIVSMGSYATSAGYYISAPGTRIFANPLSLTGSIGIFYGKVDIAQLLERIGVTVTVFKTTERADAESIFRPFTPGERKELERKVNQFYDTFLSRVAAGRGMSKKAVDRVGRGRVWTGRQALKHDLVDELGGLRQALDFARAEAGLPKNVEIVELPEIRTSIVGALLGIEGLKADAVMPLPAQLINALRAISPLLAHPADKPLARTELTEIRP